MKMLRRNKFTLVELLAAMAVFSVLLLVAMHLFSGIQKVWVRAEQKTNSFADSRTAMEFIASRLQTMIFYSVTLDDDSEDKVPFGLTPAYPNDDKNSRVYFMTAAPMNRRKDNKEIDSFRGFRFLRFKLDENSGELRMDIASSRKSRNARRFQYLAPPYETYYTSRPTEEQIFTSAFFDKNDEYSSVTIVNNVIAFKLIPYKDDLSVESSPSELLEPPEMLRIELSIIDNEDKFNDWKNATDDEKLAIQEEYGYTFQRIVVLGK